MRKKVEFIKRAPSFQIDTFSNSFVIHPYRYKIIIWRENVNKTDISPSVNLIHNITFSRSNYVCLMTDTQRTLLFTWKSTLKRPGDNSSRRALPFPMGRMLILPFLMGRMLILPFPMGRMLMWRWAGDLLSDRLAHSGSSQEPRLWRLKGKGSNHENPTWDRIPRPCPRLQSSLSPLPSDPTFTAHQS